jgi:quercetin dioxygenase-like cupin family protein
VLTGEFAITVGDRVVTVRAGDMAYIPAGVVHNFTNLGATPGRLLVSLTPGGHEAFLRELAQLAAQGPVERTAMVALAQEHHVVLLPPRS